MRLGQLTFESEFQASLGLGAEDYVITQIMELGFGIDPAQQFNPDKFVFKVFYNDYINTQLYTEKIKSLGFKE